MKILYKSEPCDGIFIIMREDGKWNYMNTKGNLLSPNMWFKSAYPFFDGFAKVQNQHRKWNIINKQGEFIYPKWFVWIGEFYKGFAKVQREDGKWNFINTKGNLLSPNLWFDCTDVYTNPLTAFIKKELYYFDAKNHKPHKYFLSDPITILRFGYDIIL